MAWSLAERRITIEVDAAGITRSRRRTLAAADIRRVYLYTDANGDDCIVARGPVLRLQFISRRELGDTNVRQGMVGLIDAIADHADIDPTVRSYLAALD